MTPETTLTTAAAVKSKFMDIGPDHVMDTSWRHYRPRKTLCNRWLYDTTADGTASAGDFIKNSLACTFCKRRVTKLLEES